MGTKKNNNELKLTEEQTEKLIDLYYEETNLWNVGSETYMNKDGRKRSLTRILEVMTDEFPGLVATSKSVSLSLSLLLSLSLSLSLSLVCPNKSGDQLASAAW